MKTGTILFFALAMAVLGQERPTEAPQQPVVMPELKVSGLRFEIFTLGPSREDDGSFALRIIPHPRKSDFFTLLVGGAQLGDLVVAVESVHGRTSVKSLDRHTWWRAVDYGELKLTVRRAIGRRSYRLLELDARRIPAP